MLQPCKRYVHDDGLFSFELPAAWSHQTEEDGTQVFWHNPSGTGTLRISSVTSQKVSHSEERPASTVLNKHSPVALRPDGVAWTHYREASSEKGKETIMFWWELAQFIPPKYFRIAFFSFTIFAYEESESRTRAMLEHLTTHIPRTMFGDFQEF